MESQEGITVTPVTGTEKKEAPAASKKIKVAAPTAKKDAKATAKKDAKATAKKDAKATAKKDAKATAKKGKDGNTPFREGTTKFELWGILKDGKEHQREELRAKCEEMGTVTQVIHHVLADLEEKHGMKIKRGEGTVQVVRKGRDGETGR